MKVKPKNDIGEIKTEDGTKNLLFPRQPDVPSIQMPSECQRPFHSIFKAAQGNIPLKLGEAIHFLATSLESLQTSMKQVCGRATMIQSWQSET